MNDTELELMEQELRKLAPARPPDELMTGLKAVGRASVAVRMEESAAEGATGEFWKRWIWWLVPAAGVAAIMIAGIWLMRSTPPTEPSDSTAASRQAATGLDNLVGKTGAHPESASPEQVEIDHNLLADYETVAEIPGTGPVRFRCSEWEDRVLVRDPQLGVSVERRTPRFEIVPVRYESY